MYCEVSTRYLVYHLYTFNFLKLVDNIWPITLILLQPDNGLAVPKFGDWDETDPASAEEYTQVFEKVREEKQSGAEKVPSMPTEPSYSNSEKRYGNGNSKVCCSSGFLCICLALYLKPYNVAIFRWGLVKLLRACLVELKVIDYDYMVQFGQLYIYRL